MTDGMSDITISERRAREVRDPGRRLYHRGLRLFLIIQGDQMFIAGERESRPEPTKTA